MSCICQYDMMHLVNIISFIQSAEVYRSIFLFVVVVHCMLFFPASITSVFTHRALCTNVFCSTQGQALRSRVVLM